MASISKDYYNDNNLLVFSYSVLIEISKDNLNKENVIIITYPKYNIIEIVKRPINKLSKTRTLDKDKGENKETIIASLIDYNKKKATKEL